MPRVLIVAALCSFGVAVGSIGVVNCLDRISHCSLFVADRIDLGSLAAGQSHQCEVSIENHSNAQVELVGASAGCDCVVVDNLPQFLTGRSVEKLAVEVRTGTSIGTASQTLTLYFADPHLQSVHVDLFWNVVKPDAVRNQAEFTHLTRDLP